MATKAQITRAEKLVARYVDPENHNLVETFRNQLMSAFEGSAPLMDYVHSMHSRMKDPDHLLEKLLRQMAKCKKSGNAFDINTDNVFTKINDLAGIRILHLYTRQVASIHKELCSIFEEQSYELLEPPFARTWDDESKAFFEGLGIATQSSETMYTSVHYVVGSASRTRVTCEIQVRTLMEEVWGEVDHALNYPQPTSILSSSEQLKVLARVTSSASRLVDSIFLTHQNQSGS
jgi:ppGpp synthetase/RelA/SpoT-type nucleotidyltranferase